MAERKARLLVVASSSAHKKWLGMMLQLFGLLLLTAAFGLPAPHQYHGGGQRRFAAAAAVGSTLFAEKGPGATDDSSLEEDDTGVYGRQQKPARATAAPIQPRPSVYAAFSQPPLPQRPFEKATTRLQAVVNEQPQTSVSPTAPASGTSSADPLTWIQDLFLHDDLFSSITAPDEKAYQQEQKTILSIPKFDAALAATYFCNSVAMTLPIVLMPLIAAEHAAVDATTSAAAFVAGVASIATLGGGWGKVVNGFVCQRLGGRQSSSLYMAGIAAASLVLSMTQTGPVIGWILAGLEFCVSIQWTACALMLADEYADKDPTKFAAGITALSVASTSGSLLAKVGGAALLQWTSWRIVAQCGAAIALLGSLIVRFFATPESQGASANLLDVGERGETFSGAASATAIEAESTPSLLDTVRTVLSSRLFWQVGLAHATAFVARTSDRVLGSFFVDATGLSGALCGGLTASVTFGFVHGLAKGNAYHSLPDSKAKTQLLQNAYLRAVVSAVGLSACALLATIPGALSLLGVHQSWVLATVIALLSGQMASSLSFQFYQIPTMVASSSFGPNKAVCISWMDALGFFLSTGTWAATSQIVGGGIGSGDFGGWPAAWVLLAGLFATGGALMMNILPQTLLREEEEGKSTQTS